MLSLYGVNQAQVQRYLSARTEKDAVRYTESIKSLILTDIYRFYFQIFYISSINVRVVLAVTTVISDTFAPLPPLRRSCYMVFPSLQLALALSCVMGLVMFACYCGEDHSSKLGTASRDAVSFSVPSAETSAPCFGKRRFLFSSFHCFLDLKETRRRDES